MEEQDRLRDTGISEVVDRPPVSTASDLPALALSYPRETVRAAEIMLSADPDAATRSFIEQARGIALRELGHVPRALEALDRALQDARSVGSAREADVEASIGGTLAHAGRIADGLAMVESAVAKADGDEAARIRVRLGLLLQMSGRPADAVVELRAASRVLHRIGDATWESRAAVNLAQSLLDLGQTRDADTALVRAEELQSGVTFEAAMARQNRGLVAVLEGRIPEALAHYETAGLRFAQVGAVPTDLLEARARALRHAGLFDEALACAQQAVESSGAEGASVAYHAEALVAAADAAIAAGRQDVAVEHASAALALFRSQGRERGATLARLAVARARRSTGEHDAGLAGELSAIANESRRRRMPETVEADLLAGETLLAIGDRSTARFHLGRAQQARTRRSDIGKVLGWRATALSAQAAGRRASVLKACGAGLDVLEGHQATLGAIEMRAAATTHGLPLAQMAVRATVEAGDPAQMLHWVERWRSTTLRLPAVRLPDDPELATALARLRLVRLRLDEATASGARSTGLTREVADLEAAVRDRTRRVPADGSTGDGPFEMATALGSLDGATLVEIFQLDGVVHVLVADDDGVRHHLAGSLETAERAVEFARFSLRRMSHRTFAERARASLPTQALVLQQAVLGAAADELGDGPVVVVPPASLASAPWGVLPALRGRAVCVAASTASWWSARHSTASGDRVALVAGPSLAQASAEVELLSERYPYASVLSPQDSTAEAVLLALDGAALAHVAAHGTFRADNPLFSALQLADGPLTVYDLQRLRRAPHRLVLSCCDSGTVSAAGADEVLGLASALVPLGMAGMVAATVPVSDEAAVPFSLGLHDRLQGGASTADALRDARMAADNPAAYAIAHSFTAFGAS